MTCFALLPGAHLSIIHEISFLTKTAVSTLLNHHNHAPTHSLYSTWGGHHVNGKAPHVHGHDVYMHAMIQRLDGSDDDCFDYTPTAELLKLNKSAVWQYS